MHFAHNRTLAPLTFLTVVLFSWLSFRYYEQPIIAWGKRKAAGLQMPRRISQDAPSITLAHTTASDIPVTTN